ncbi:bis(5'-nucleosyl)-tetraphosphatase [asymmetrical]-like [Artemia franciscana]|uniref:Bis(5'-nucleosyl)-tetraphosphatase [asymmetrical] n=1 Tax=Artemia franciscana TaxID=6661 RepID=A0AA88H4Z6_ARTSF|nr:hypothetical protein QYM36_017122 [Artemia franciscana]KAK2704964.1 hypothetical protein QYM36_017122 [Artemia franciscana]
MNNVPLRAAGTLLFRVISNEIQYLLMQASDGEHHWSPPKGHLEEGENEREAAVRETVEEAGIGLQDYDILNFKESLSYEVKGRPKVSVYFLARLKDPNKKITMSEEHQDYKWLNLKMAKDIAQFQDLCSLLDRCEEFIRTNCDM